MTKSLVNPDDGPVDRHAQPGDPGRVAVLPDRVPVDYEEAAVGELAAALIAVGIRREDRVLIAMPDGAGFTEAFIGTIKLAAVPLPVNPMVSADDLVTVAGEAGARLAVVPAQRAQTLTDLAAELVVPVDGPQGTWATVLRLG